MWKRAFFLSIVIQLFFLPVKADEGMWLPWNLSQSQIDKMQKMGLKLSAEDIFGTQKSSLKDAIVSLDHGSCTGSFISPKGLLLTNHHCAYGEIQKHSTIAHDYLKTGFWAESYDDELPNPGKTATLLIEARNVTSLFSAPLSEASGRIQTERVIDSISSAILDTLTIAPELDAQIKDFLFRNEFYLLITETFRDVRLVGAPPEEIGQFGGEKDNWMWPRHSADFALFRVYSGPDGKPADYNPNNIPFQPARVLRLSTLGIKEDSFTMTVGYPGNTNRYMTASGIIETKDILNPVIGDVRRIRQEIWQKNMRKSPSTGIQYADKYASSCNYYKYAIGQNKSITQLNLIAKRRAQEQILENWIDTQPALKTQYGSVLASNQILHRMRKNLSRSTYITLESLINGPEIGSLIIDAFKLYANIRKEDGDPVKTIHLIKELQTKANDFFQDFSPDIDQSVFKAMLHYYEDNLEDSLQIERGKLLGQAKNIRQLSKKIYKESAFSNLNRFMQFIKNPKTKKFENDPAFAFYKRVFENFGPDYSMFKRLDQQLDYTMHRYIQIKQLYQPNKNFYPDANSTMRLSYGKVIGYTTPIGKVFPAFSYFNGMMKKSHSSKEYRTQIKLNSLFHDTESNMEFHTNQTPLCFISDNDITGGNSGSPVLNGKGELVGLAFDGNWEGMASDLSYNENYQRCINVDIRYVLFLIKELGKTSQLMDELTFSD